MKESNKILIEGNVLIRRKLRTKKTLLVFDLFLSRGNEMLQIEWLSPLLCYVMYFSCLDIMCRTNLEFLYEHFININCFPQHEV